MAEAAVVLHQPKPAETELGGHDPEAKMLALNSVQQHKEFSTWVEIQVGLTHSTSNLPAISLYHSFRFLLKTSLLAVFNHSKVISVTVVTILAKEPEEQSPGLLAR